MVRLQFLARLSHAQRSRTRVMLALACPLAIVAGCGNSRTAAPDVSRPATPSGIQQLRFAAAGVSFAAPGNWAAVRGQAPLIATIGSGSALVALWRYPRSEPLPASGEAMRAARQRLIEAVKARYPPLRVIRANLLTVDGLRAIEIDAFERIAGRPRRVRSLHIFGFGAELVLDEYSPPGAFHTVDHEVFSPLKRSLLLFPAVAA